jgi:hypothetical protein
MHGGGGASALIPRQGSNGKAVPGVELDGSID